MTRHNRGDARYYLNVTLKGWCEKIESHVTLGMTFSNFHTSPLGVTCKMILHITIGVTCRIILHVTKLRVTCETWLACHNTNFRHPRPLLPPAANFNFKWVCFDFGIGNMGLSKDWMKKKKKKRNWSVTLVFAEISLGKRSKDDETECASLRHEIHIQHGDFELEDFHKGGTGASSSTSRIHFHSKEEVAEEPWNQWRSKNKHLGWLHESLFSYPYQGHSFSGWSWPEFLDCEYFSK